MLNNLEHLICKKKLKKLKYEREIKKENLFINIFSHLNNYIIYFSFKFYVK